MDFNILKSYGQSCWKPIGRAAIFDFTLVKADDLATRYAGAVELLYEAAKKGGAPGELVDGIDARADRRVRFYSDPEMITIGTPTKTPTYIEPGGTSVWKWVKGSGSGARYVDRTIPVSERDDERVYCKPGSSVTNFGPYVQVIWHELTHIFTLLSHGRWSSKGGFEEPNSPENIEWHSFIQRLRVGAPDWSKDPVSGEASFVAHDPTEWVCTCGATQAG